jgi:ribosomal protein S18 acetylase RimI-like enzyme
MIRVLEEISNNALPALQTIFYDGWILRLSDSIMRRANSISPLYESTLPLEEKIAYCEALYAERGRRIVYKLTDQSQPADLEGALLANGYYEDCRTSVQVLELNGAHPSTLNGDLTVEMSDQPTDAWFASNADFHDAGERRKLVTQAIFASLVPPAIYVRLLHRDQPAAVGMAVLERGWVGLYSITVAPPFRQQGIGVALTQTLIKWGADCGAHHAYLQVMTNNAPALKLYEKLGFTEAYQYWYLQK